MLVRGAGETFNLVVPMRRLHEFAKKHKLEWALDASLPCPTQEEIDKIPVEEDGVSSETLKEPSLSSPLIKDVIFMDKEHSLLWKNTLEIK